MIPRGSCPGGIVVAINTSTAYRARGTVVGVRKKLPDALMARVADLEHRVVYGVGGSDSSSSYRPSSVTGSVSANIPNAKDAPATRRTNAIVIDARAAARARIWEAPWTRLRPEASK